ncbi:MAG TPA: nuclear transport factor 2 family protein [Candidatus Limnocylindrales bacterium]|nr:nuclear transport factor 2 family protein [Candidatus Limnocylindrales bacterium]
MNDPAALMTAEHAWKDAMAAHDRAALEQLVAPDFRLIVGVAGRPLQVMTRERWFGSIHLYEIETASFDDAQTTLAGDIGIVTLLWTQRATVNGADRSATFFITDLWRYEHNNWRVFERHSSRPEPPTASSETLKRFSE